MQISELDFKISNLNSWSFGYFWCTAYHDAFSTPEIENNNLLVQARFLNHFGFDCAGISFKNLDRLSQEDRQQLLDYLNQKMLTFHPLYSSLHFDAVSKETAEEEAKIFKENLVKYGPFYQRKIVSCNLESGTRFDTDMTVEDRIAKITENIIPFAQAAHDLGYQFAIENCGDFYCHEIVQICQNAPYLMMLFDTGNTYLIGEDPIQATYTAAPYTVAVHFRDVKVQPDASRQIINFEHAHLGDGDVPLKEIHDILMANSPEPLSLMFETELSHSIEKDPWECLKTEIDYINSMDD